MSTKKGLSRVRIKKSIRGKISGTNTTPRVSVFRSNKSIYAQLIDDVAGVTLASVSIKNLAKVEGSKSDQSKAVGLELAKQASAKGVTEVIFDRNGYMYHGRIKALAEGAREGGLKF